jgi:hypothetical protein
MGLCCNRSTCSKSLSAASVFSSLSATALTITSTYFLLKVEDADSVFLPDKLLRASLATSFLSVIIFSSIAVVTCYDFFTVTRERKILEATVSDVRSAVLLLKARTGQAVDGGVSTAVSAAALAVQGGAEPARAVSPAPGVRAALPGSLEAVIRPHKAWPSSSLHRNMISLCRDVEALHHTLYPSVPRDEIFDPP